MIKFVKSFYRLIILFPAVFYLFHLLYFWLYETTDSFFYWAFANYIKTGTYHASSPYYYTVPSTMEPPLYSLFIYIAQYFPRPDIIIHAVQIFSLFLSSFFIYKILSHYNSDKYALFCAAIFLFNPANIIFTSNFTAESFSVFAISLFCYLSFLIISKKQFYLIGLLIIISAISSLLRYNLIVLFFISLFIAFHILFRKKQLTKIKIIYTAVYAILGSFILLFWIIVNYKINGSIGLSSGMGKNLYDRVIAENHLLPPATNSYYKELSDLTDHQVNLFQYWWFIEAYIMLYKYSTIYANETYINNLLQKVSFSAITANFWDFLRLSPVFYLRNYSNSPPFPPARYIDSRVIKRRVFGSIQFYRPILKSENAIQLWNFITSSGDAYYRHFNTLLSVTLLFPAIVVSFFRKNNFYKYLSFSYLLLSFLPSLMAHPDSRYVYPLVGMEFILICGNFYLLWNNRREIWKRARGTKIFYSLKFIRNL